MILEKHAEEKTVSKTIKEKNSNINRQEGKAQTRKAVEAENRKAHTQNDHIQSSVPLV